MVFELNKSTRLTVLTGAGISAESGLKTFRDADGLWENHSIEEVATPSAFRNNPVLVWKFYKQRFAQLNEVKPNPAHYALVDLEKFLQDNFYLITQNVDNLHTQAGNKQVYEMHGTLLECFCTACSAFYRMETIDLAPTIPLCPKCNSALRPNIVWFGEMPYFTDKIYRILYKTDIFLVIGTSGTVYPASQFLPAAKQTGAFTIGVNYEPPLNYRLFDEFYQGKAGEILPKLVTEWIR
jgi:NAD-dependent deacetylase